VGVLRGSGHGFDAAATPLSRPATGLLGHVLTTRNALGPKAEVAALTEILEG